MEKVTNIRVAGLGGMGVLRATLILGELLFEVGYDVKKAEVHGMSQRGGSISSDLRFGKKVISPMIPDKKIDILVSMAPEWSDIHKENLAPNGILISAADIDESKLQSAKSMNIALLGALSKHLEIAEDKWIDIIKRSFPEKLHAANLEAFKLGRDGK